MVDCSFTSVSRYSLAVAVLTVVVGLGHSHLLYEAMEFDMSQWLSQAICNHLAGWNV